MGVSEVYTRMRQGFSIVDEGCSCLANAFLGYYAHVFDRDWVNSDPLNDSRRSCYAYHVEGTDCGDDEEWADNYQYLEVEASSASALERDL